MQKKIIFIIFATNQSKPFQVFHPYFAAYKLWHHREHRGRLGASGVQLGAIKFAIVRPTARIAALVPGNSIWLRARHTLNMNTVGFRNGRANAPGRSNL